MAASYPAIDGLGQGSEQDITCLLRYEWMNFVLTMLYLPIGKKREAPRQDLGLVLQLLKSRDGAESGLPGLA